MSSLRMYVPPVSHAGSCRFHTSVWPRTRRAWVSAKRTMASVSAKSYCCGLGRSGPNLNAFSVLTMVKSRTTALAYAGSPSSGPP
jgi:hypothetical protein